MLMGGRPVSHWGFLVEAVISRCLLSLPGRFKWPGHICSERRGLNVRGGWGETEGGWRVLVVCWLVVWGDGGCNGCGADDPDWRIYKLSKDGEHVLSRHNVYCRHVRVILRVIQWQRTLPKSEYPKSPDERLKCGLRK